MLVAEFMGEVQHQNESIATCKEPLLKQNKCRWAGSEPHREHLIANARQDRPARSSASFEADRSGGKVALPPHCCARPLCLGIRLAALIRGGERNGRIQPESHAHRWTLGTDRA